MNSEIGEKHTAPPA